MKTLGLFITSLTGKASILVVSILTFLGFLNVSQWQFIFLDQPRPHYCLIGCVGLALVAIVSQCNFRKQWIILGLISLLINTCLVLPNILPYSKLLSSKHHQSNSEISIAHLTLDNHSLDLDLITKYINSKNLDIVSILEIPLSKLVILDEQLKEFDLVSPNVSLNLTSSAANAWFISKSAKDKGLLFRSSQLVNIPKNSTIPMMELDVFFKPFNEDIRLLSFQARRPTNAVRVALFHRELSGLISWYKTQEKEKEKNIIIVGDFNTAPWSVSFRKFSRSTGLKNTDLGYGPQPTWHSKLPSFLRIPIDHILCSRDFEVVYRESKGDIGSDHLPVMAKLQKI